MSKLWARFAGLFISNKTFAGMDKSGNRYFARTEPIDGIRESRLARRMSDGVLNSVRRRDFSVTIEVFVKEKRWVIFKGEQDPTSIPVERICWLNGQRKRAPTPEEMAELEARRERVKLNVALIKKEEEERRAKEGKGKSIGKGVGPDLKSFIQQYPTDSEGNKINEASDSKDVSSDKGSSEESQKQKEVPEHIRNQPESLEPTGSGASFKPGTWQPPT